MNRLSALVTWIFLSVFLTAPAFAASDAVPVDPQQTGTEVKATPTTPAAALTWQEREKARSETKKRAEALREAQIKEEEKNQPPATNPAVPENQTPPAAAK